MCKCEAEKSTVFGLILYQLAGARVINRKMRTRISGCPHRCFAHFCHHVANALVVNHYTQGVVV